MSKLLNVTIYLWQIPYHHKVHFNESKYFGVEIIELSNAFIKELMHLRE